MRIMAFLGFFLAILWINPIAENALAQTNRANSNNPQSDENICTYMVGLAEKARRIPSGLLLAIAQTESGRYRVAQTLSQPWPWTVSSAQTSNDDNFYQTKAQALNIIENLQNDGITNIDVGCMQINLFYHGRGFNSLQEAIDPINNVAYATEFLLYLFNRFDNWGEAVKHYHSSDPSKNNYYLEKVLTAYQRINTKPNNATLQELRIALNKPNNPPLPPSADSEELLAKNSADFAEDLRNRINAFNSNLDAEQNAQDRGYVEELRVWREWEKIDNLDDITGRDPDYYINLLDNDYKIK
ncbi:MAG: transglycosylase SLT domain-containing protein [Alphaproteobacteria bacterium]|nr:transglycosylase SLT domain-containing protein [Alphaproteobacteria bacterium]